MSILLRILVLNSILSLLKVRTFTTVVPHRNRSPRRLFCLHALTNPDKRVRRNILKLSFINLSTTLYDPRPSHALVQTETLEQRILENLMTPPFYGMESPDIFYPSSLAGTWNVTSILTHVEAPCGEKLFGGETRLQKAKEEVGSVLSYRSRFINGKIEDSIIADREFNVQEIAKASMGSNSVLNVEASPNLVSCTLLPLGSSNVMRADLVILGRRQEYPPGQGDTFIGGEISQQIIASVDERNMGQVSSNRVIKQIETISLFRPIDETQVQCTQRTATFLVPNQQDIMTLKMWELTQGRPIDVRFFQVVYSKEIDKKQTY